METNLWNLALSQCDNDAGDEMKAEENSIVFVGSKNSGKTSIILRFLDRDEPPKPTVALEYTFGRRAKGHNIAKDVGHIWELGGGTWLSKLIDIPITVDHIKNLAVILVLDLSKPEELWFNMEKLLTSVRARVDEVIKQAGDPGLKQHLKEKVWERIGEDHPDKDMLNPFPIPFVIIGGKYDIFQDFEPEKRKVICRTLRFIAHTNGAHLQFFSTRQEAMMTRARALVSHLLFNTASSKSLQVEHNKPLLVPWGNDTMQQIGSPPVPEGDLGRVSARNPTELWRVAYTSHFPQQNVSDPALVEDPAKDTQYLESAVDTMRAQKNEELERYRKMSERKQKEAQRNNQGY